MMQHLHDRVLEVVPWMDRLVVTALGVGLCVIGALMFTVGASDVAFPVVWACWFVASGAVTVAYAARWTRAGWMRSWSGAFAVTATASRAVGLLVDAYAGDGSALPTGRLLISVTAWGLVSMLILWGWVRVLPYSHRPARRSVVHA